LTAFDPVLITYGGFFTSEIPSVALLLTALWLGHSAGGGSERARIATGERARIATGERARIATGERARIATALVAGAFGGAAIVIRPQLVLNLAVMVIALWPWRPRRARMLALTCGIAFAVAGGIAYSSAATGHFTMIAQNSGINFFQTRCSVRILRLTVSRTELYVFASPTWYTRRGGHDYYFRGIPPGDQGFFYRPGLRCLTRDVPNEIGGAARNVIDMTVTSVPWPQSGDKSFKSIVGISNVAYCVAVVIALLLAYRWRPQRAAERTRLVLRPVAGPRPSIKILAWQLAPVLPIAVLFGGEPRFRVPYDPFGLIIIAIVVSAWFTRLAPPPPEQRTGPDK
jgi:hypothetical protein